MRCSPDADRRARAVRVLTAGRRLYANIAEQPISCISAQYTVKSARNFSPLLVYNTLFALLVSAQRAAARRTSSAARTPPTASRSANSLTGPLTCRSARRSSDRSFHSSRSRNRFRRLQRTSSTCRRSHFRRRCSQVPLCDSSGIG